MAKVALEQLQPWWGTLNCGRTESGIRETPPEGSMSLRGGKGGTYYASGGVGQLFSGILPTSHTYLHPVWCMPPSSLVHPYSRDGERSCLWLSYARSVLPPAGCKVYRAVASRSWVLPSPSTSPTVRQHGSLMIQLKHALLPGWC